MRHARHWPLPRSEKISVCDAMSDDKNQLKAVPVRRRSAARLAAIQITYQSLITGQSAVDFVPQFLSHYADDVSKSFRVKDLDHDHLTNLYAGVEAGRDELDRVIGAALSDGWSIDRLARIELAVLRCGAYELTAMPHIPARAVVSEYAALSDACGCEVGFVNAVLDGLARDTRIVEIQS
jgi:N utilization substance protein B